MKECVACGTPEVDDEANFCASCGAKLGRICNCWVLNKPYDCGQAQCPGHEGFIRHMTEKIKM